jgi:hypothetical protein
VGNNNTRWYSRYVLWNFVQSLSGSAQWVLTTNAMLVGVGVGVNTDPATLTAWAVTLNWVLKDGLGMCLVSVCLVICVCVSLSSPLLNFMLHIYGSLCVELSRVWCGVVW